MFSYLQLQLPQALPTHVPWPYFVQLVWYSHSWKQPDDVSSGPQSVNVCTGIRECSKTAWEIYHGIYQNIQAWKMTWTRFPDQHYRPFVSNPPDTSLPNPCEDATGYPTQGASDDSFHDDVIQWKHFPRNLPFVRGIHRSPVGGREHQVLYGSRGERHTRDALLAPNTTMR